MRGEGREFFTIDVPIAAYPRGSVRRLWRDTERVNISRFRICGLEAHPTRWGARHSEK